MNWTLLYIIASLLILPMFLYGIFAESNTFKVFKKYAKYPTEAGIGSAELATALLKKGNVHDVEVVPIKKLLDDCYDPRHKVIKISEQNFNNASIAGISVAAHEVGHAMQDHEKSFLFRLRIAIVPFVNLISKAYIPLILVGSILSFTFMIPAVGYWICWASVIAYGASLLFYLITLPLEFNASKRALTMLKETGIFTNTELKYAKEVLNAAAQTYIAASLTQLIYFLRFLSYAMIFTDRK